jgi:hypothetical protein
MGKNPAVRRISDIAADFKRNIAAALPLLLRRTIGCLSHSRRNYETVWRPAADSTAPPPLAGLSIPWRYRQACGIHRLRQAQSHVCATLAGSHRMVRKI